jgi:hypothetical protein
LAIVSTVMAHLALKLLDQGADILNAPCSDPRSEFHWPGKTSRLDALPPSRSAHRNHSWDRRIRIWVANDLGKTEVAGLGELVHVGLLPSVSERCHPLRADYLRIARWVLKTRPKSGRGDRWVWAEWVGGSDPSLFEKIQYLLKVSG